MLPTKNPYIQYTTPVAIDYTSNGPNLRHKFPTATPISTILSKPNGVQIHHTTVFQRWVISLKVQFARKIEVTRKQWANCKIHVTMRKKITFRSKPGETLIASRRLSLIKVVHFTSVSVYTFNIQPGDRTPYNLRKAAVYGLFLAF